MTESRKNVIERVKKATVAVACLNTDSEEPFTIFGSGFCVDPSGIVITCRHVVEAFMTKTIAQQISEASPSKSPKGMRPVCPGNVLTPHAVFYDTTTSSENIIAIPAQPRNISAKTDKDLAALLLLPHTGFPEGYPFLEIEEFENISEGDEIGVCGFPLGNYLFKQLGTVTSSFTKGILSSIIPGPNVNYRMPGRFSIERHRNARK